MRLRLVTDMQPNLYNVVRIVAVMATLLALLGHHYLPPKRTLLHPTAGHTANLYADELWGGKSTAEWIDQEQFHWRCTLAQSEHYPICGMAISFSEGQETIDLSPYEGLLVKLKYIGDAVNLRMYLRNHNPAYSTLDNPDSMKFNSVTVRAVDFAHDETHIYVSEFSPSDWWLEENDIPRALARAEVDRIAALGFDFPHPLVFGAHEIKLESIELISQWLTREQLYLGIILAWMCILAWEAASRMLTLYRHNRLYSQKIQDLTNYTQQLQYQTDKYKTLSDHDSLTGAFNRNGLAPVVERVFKTPGEFGAVSVVVFDIDHFKRVNDRRGHDAGDRILCELADVVRHNTRKQDTFTRWGGEEFMLLSTATDETAARGLAEKLRSVVARHVFEPQDPLQITLSIGVATVRPKESFESAFKRADNALYRAKDLGRNCVIMA